MLPSAPAPADLRATQLTVAAFSKLEGVERLCHTAAMTWAVVLVDEMAEWYLALDPETATLVEAAIDLLAAEGPRLGRPMADRITSSKIANMKELRPGSGGQSEVRILFVFDPARQAVLLVAGDKAGQWQRWYRDNIPIAERRYEKWLAGGYADERSV